MPQIDQQAMGYLLPPANSFWRWSPDGKVITWADGRTIGFKGEVQQILAGLAANGLPPLGAVLLMVAACRDGWMEAGGARGLLAGYTQALTSPPPMKSELVGSILGTTIVRELQRAFDEMDRIALLPPQLRQPLAAKVAMAQMAFDGEGMSCAGVAAANVLEVLHSGINLAGVVELAADKSTRNTLVTDLDALAAGLCRVTAERLALRLRTGLDEVVEEPDLDLPPVERVRQLLDVLRNDKELAGLANLARNVMAAVHVPRALAAPEDLPMGGVSDISNRGPLDRLLLSELAYDSTTLAARIALNEALYLRRESPASTPPPRRVILIDTGIRLWGLPRLFAAAVSMALAATAEPAADLDVYEARADGVDKVDLGSRAGLVKHLETLRTQPHSATSLKYFVEAISAGGKQPPTEMMLVTHEDVLADLEFLRALRSVGEVNWHIATVSRTGTFRLYHITASARKLLGQANIGLEDILAGDKGPQAPIPLRRPGMDPSLPVILSVDPFPLLLPHRVDPKRAISAGKYGLLGITHDGRLLQWWDRAKGARQLSDQVQFATPGKLFVDEERATAYVARWRQRTRSLFILAVNLQTREVISRHVPCEQPLDVAYHNGAILLLHKHSFSLVVADTGTKMPSVGVPMHIDWVSQRFYRQPAYYEHGKVDAPYVWHAAGFDGSFGRYERIGPSDCMFMFDREGSGPWMLWKNGTLRSPDGAMLKPPGLHEDILALEGVSADGQWIVARGKSGHHQLDLHAQQPSWSAAHYQWPALLCGKAIVLSAATWINPRTRIRRVSHENRQTLMLHTDGRVLAIALNDGGAMVLADRGPSTAQPASVPFVRVKSPPPAWYKLRVASWPDGSRAYMDSRGTLHLKSSDPKVPEVSFALSDQPIGGWTSDGHTFGNSFFLEHEPTITTARVMEIIRAFIARLP